MRYLFPTEVELLARELRDAAEGYRRVSHRPAAVPIHLGRRLSLAALKVCSCLIFLPTMSW